MIGPNGAGKSTMFNVVTGLYEPDDGSIRFRGANIVGLKPNQVTKLGIARTFQTVHLFPNMTILENAMVGQHCRTRSGVIGSVLGLPGTRREGAHPREGARASGSSARAWPATGRSSRPPRSRTRTGDDSRWRGRWPRTRRS